ncbi:glycosyltransferase family 2 protein [Altibacter sp. HG106]|uniref:glycosyltransferase family 2 protein n=1 Tax=Altibacter sp. HG106 TaxID=3023937 RepID=UPI00235054BC|nr:glycosyltransferase family 2 protein [Altibacter sp. HG106]MDC7995014.1 glycosyltransferase family 2 protein [Altibacter sp. HG106]
MASKPLISVITPLYNSAHTIAETLQSVQAQTYAHWEHIIVDDASTDGSEAIVQTFTANDERVTLISLNTNSGSGYCRNRGTETAKGDYIAFLDADDLWHPEKLERQLHFMKDHSCAVSYTSYLHIDPAGHPTGTRIVARPTLSYCEQHSNNYIGNLTGMYEVAALGKIEAPLLRKRQDWALWLEAIQRSGGPALGLQEDLAYYRTGSKSLSANKWKLIKYNYLFYKQHLGYGTLKSVYYLLRFFWEYFLVRPRYIQKL